MLSWLTAVEIWNSKPAIIDKNWCSPAGQDNYKNKNVIPGTEGLASEQTAEDSQVTALGNTVCGIQAFTTLKRQARRHLLLACCLRKEGLTMAAPQALGRGQETEGKALMTTCCPIDLSHIFHCSH